MPGEIKKIEKVQSFFCLFVLLLEHMMIKVACTKKYTRPEMTKTGFLDQNNLQLQGEEN